MSNNQLFESVRRYSLPGSFSNINAAAHQLKDYLQGIMLTTCIRDIHTATGRSARRVRMQSACYTASPTGRKIDCLANIWIAAYGYASS